MDRHVLVQFRNTSTFLIELLSKDPLALYNIEDKGINASSLNFWDNGAIPLITILHQTGYLTIKGSFTFFGTPSYTLDYPNEEVRSSVAPILIALITKKETSGVVDMLKADEASTYLKKIYPHSSLSLKVYLWKLPVILQG